MKCRRMRRTKPLSTTSVSTPTMPKFFFFNDPPPTKISTLPLHDALPITHRPPQLSGGEQQPAAMPRALANHPRGLWADDPTGNLDPKPADGVFEMLIALVRLERLSAL